MTLLTSGNHGTEAFRYDQRERHVNNEKPGNRAHRKEMHITGGVIAAKILLGANPAETPIETPAKFEFVLNLKTAKLFGLAIPATVLLRADGVIE